MLEDSAVATQFAEQPWWSTPVPCMLTLSEATAALVTDEAAKTACEEFRSDALRLARGGDRERKQRLLMNAQALNTLQALAPAWSPRCSEDVLQAAVEGKEGEANLKAMWKRVFEAVYHWSSPPSSSWCGMEFQGFASLRSSLSLILIAVIVAVGDGRALRWVNAVLLRGPWRFISN